MCTILYYALLENCEEYLLSIKFYSLLVAYLFPLNGSDNVMLKYLLVWCETLDIIIWINQQP